MNLISKTIKKNVQKSIVMAGLVIAIAFTATNCLALDFEKVVDQIRNNKVSIDLISNLVMLEGTDQKVGFGLCVMAGNEISKCYKNGSVGYGMCVASGLEPNQCDRKGSVGYGLCVTLGIDPLFCDRNGSVGYGMCISAGNTPKLCY